MNIIFPVVVHRTLLLSEIRSLMDNNTNEKGIYKEVWLDCGITANTVYSSQRILEFNKSANSASAYIKNVNSVVIQPCFIGENVILENAIFDPYVSSQNGSQNKNSIVKIF
jgi:glucose-1-phosphate thymidylyltransferase